jgi:hypothetical protein
MNFEEWKKTGPLLIKALRDRGEEESFRKLLSDLYPKKAHFIYELFQNAEDVGAKSCKFILNEDELIFEHDGRIFSEQDVVGITGIGNSTKKNDPTKIGKFGVGFKAVFAYTDTPEIHSGRFNFRIRDLLVIEDIPPLNSENFLNNNSRFIFPFNHSEKSKLEAFLEIKNALNNLTDNTLLFLSSISKIEYSLDGVKGGLERNESFDHVVEIINKRPNSSKYISSWLRFDKKVEILNEDDQMQNCRISLAFKLDSSNSKIKRLLPLDRGDVSIYFPAESEVSNLFFHIHAPFASTVARDCVRDSESNNLLRDELTILLVEALSDIKKYGYLNVDFLGVLPNSSDNHSAFYRPFWHAVIQAFRSQKLTPTLSGEFACADALFIGANDIQKVIADDDLSIITNFDTPLWCKNPDQNDSRSASFLSDLLIDEWGYEELKDFLSGWSDHDVLQSWLTEKSDEQLFNLYAFLGKASVAGEAYFGSINSPVVRTFHKGAIELARPSESFFPVDDDGKSSNEIRYVKSEVYCKYGSKSAQKNAISFLTEIGVKPYDQKALVIELLGKYENGFQGSLEEHLLDLRTFLNFEKEFPRQIYQYKHKKIILCDQGGDQSFMFLRNIYLDNEYIVTHLDHLKAIHKKKKLSNFYERNLTENEFKEFIHFLKNYGVFYKFEIAIGSISQFSHPEKSFLKSGFGNESSRTIDRDYSIPDLKKYLKINSMHVSKLIWDCCMDATPECFDAVYLRNAQNEERRLDSSLIYILREAAWIPDKQGNLLKPELVSAETLHPDFLIRSANNFLEKIGFGIIKRKEIKEYEVFKSVVESRGLSVVDVDQVLSLMSEGVNILDLKNFFKQKSVISKPTARVENYERRKKNVLEDSGDVPSVKSILAERKIQQGLDEVRAKSRAYLRPLYKNIDDELICQCCQKVMPFKLKSTGEYYFEATQIFKKINSQHYQLRLALCPNCSAMYEHGVELEDSLIIDRILNIDIKTLASNIELPIDILGKEYLFFFVEKHLFDAQVLLQNN